MTLADNNYFRFRPYRNPQDFDESMLPSGYRMRYADEPWSFLPEGTMYRARLGDWFRRPTNSCLASHLLTYVVPVCPLTQN